jgi:hypothetical protein
LFLALYYGYVGCFHKVVKYRMLFVVYRSWMEKCMKQIAEKDRKELEAKLSNVFEEKMESLPTELREILLDDMVTAFENRLNVLNRATVKGEN